MVTILNRTLPVVSRTTNCSTCHSTLEYGAGDCAPHYSMSSNRDILLHQMSKLF